MKNYQWKTNKKPNLNGYISKTRAISGSELKFSESSFKFLQNSLVFWSLYPGGYMARDSDHYKLRCHGQWFAAFKELISKTPYSEAYANQRKLENYVVRREYFIANEYGKIRNRLTLERILLGVSKTVFSINSLTWFEWQNQESSCNILSGSRFHCVKIASELKSADGSTNTFHQLSEIFQKLPKFTTILLEKSLMTMLYSKTRTKGPRFRCHSNLFLYSSICCE